MANTCAVDAPARPAATTSAHTSAGGEPAGPGVIKTGAISTVVIDHPAADWINAGSDRDPSAQILTVARIGGLPFLVTAYRVSRTSDGRLVPDSRCPHTRAEFEAIAETAEGDLTSAATFLHRGQPYLALGFD